MATLSPPAPNVTPGDLAELMAAFNEVTARLEGTHESLRREVARLEAELESAKQGLKEAQALLAEIEAELANL